LSGSVSLRLIFLNFRVIALTFNRSGFIESASEKKGLLSDSNPIKSKFFMTGCSRKTPITSRYEGQKMKTYYVVGLIAFSFSCIELICMHAVTSQHERLDPDPHNINVDPQPCK
jgi:hypothetical protein